MKNIKITLTLTLPAPPISLRPVSLESTSTHLLVRQVDDHQIRLASGAIRNEKQYTAINIVRRLAIAFLGLGSVIGNASAEIAQAPMFLTAPPPPNVMFILDNSLSMKWGSLTGSDAEGEFTSPKYNFEHNNDACTGPSGICSKDGKKNQMAYYSSDWNRIYYDPAIRYLPGLTSDGISMGNIDPGKAPINPYGTSNSVNLRDTCTSNTNRIPRYDPVTFVKNTNCKSTPSLLHNRAAYAFHYDWPDPDVNGETNGKPAQERFYTRNDIVPTTNKYSKSRARTDCIADPGQNCTYEEEIQNFANWFSYYRTRMLLTKTMLGIAFSDISDRFRVGFSTINYNPTHFVPVGNFDIGQKELWYKHLYRANPFGDTPLVTALDRIGRYYQGFGVPSVVSPDPIQRQCQRNYAILSTDGYWNASKTKIGNRDKTVPFDLPAAITFDPISGTPWEAGQLVPRPFYEGSIESSDTVSDTAMKYWATDIGFRNSTGGTAGKIAANASDPATWQNMVTHTIGLGVNGTLTYQPDYQSAITGDYAAIKNGTINWPTPEIGKPTTIDDIWHAAVNGRGRYFNAKNPQDLKNGLLSVLKLIDQQQQYGAGSSIAYAGASSATKELAYVPSFEPLKWTGHLKAYSLKNDGSQGDLKWNAAELLPSPDARNIVTWDDHNMNASKFRWNNLSTTQQAYLKSPAILAYLRGSPDLEQSADGSGDHPYRYRENKLGDIVNSSPIYVRKTNFGHATASPNGHGGETYAAFLEYKAARDGMLYVGANDGMLHAFDATTGLERFAFVPNSVFPSLATLSDPHYKHRFFVDGPLAEGDAFWNGTWKNILLGSTGAGSHGVFAIDITNPSPLELNTKSVLWELGASGNFSDLGNVLGAPSLVRLTDGRWAAIFGNGYDSIEGTATLYIVNIATGQRIRALNTGVGSKTSPNGLSAPGLLFNNKRELIAAYAGDLQGTLWKFDLSSPDVNLWTSTKMFIAKTAEGAPEPIVQQPVLAPHPMGGFIITFGTGKYFETADITNIDKQTLYGIWDKPGEFDLKDREDLQPQFLRPLEQNGVTIGRILTTNHLDWTTKRGWYIDMMNPGERFVGRLAILENTVLLSTTLAPVKDVCAGGGTSFTMATNFLTGSVAKDFYFVGAEGKPIKDADGNNVSSIATEGTTSGGVSIPGASSDCVMINHLNGTTTCVPYVTTPKIIRRWRQLTNQTNQ